MRLNADAWERIDTVLLDMDGTLLDLAFDNYFWHELLPRQVARARGEPVECVRTSVREAYDSLSGSLDWYCVDYWSDRLALDLVALKAASSHRIGWLPGAREFLAAARAGGKRLVLVTNAHRKTLAVKKAVTGLETWFDMLVSSHDHGRPKEHGEFWLALQRQLDFDPARTAFIDDSLPVLAAARGHGIARLWAVTQPDTRAAPREVSGYPGIRGVGELLSGQEQP